MQFFLMTLKNNTMLHKLHKNLEKKKLFFGIFVIWHINICIWYFLILKVEDKIQKCHVAKP